MRIAILLLGLTTGCQATYKIATSPAGAVVKIGDEQLGATPLSLDKATLRNQECYSQDTACLLSVSAEGFTPEWIAIAPSTRSFELKIELSNRSTDTEVSTKKVIADAALADLQAEGTRLLRLQTRLFDQQSLPLAEMEPLIRKYPNVAAVNFLYAMSLYQTGDQTQALSYLRKAQEIAPQEVDYRIIARKMEAENN